MPDFVLRAFAPTASIHSVQDVEVQVASAKPQVGFALVVNGTMSPPRPDTGMMMQRNLQTSPGQYLKHKLKRQLGVMSDLTLPRTVRLQDFLFTTRCRDG